MKSITHGTRYPEDVHEYVKAQAKKEGRSFNNMVVKILTDHRESNKPLKEQVLDLANKLAFEGCGNQAVRMHAIHSSL